MKKAIAFLLVLVTVIGLFSACAIKPSSNYEPYETYAVGGYDCEYPINIDDIDWAYPRIDSNELEGSKIKVRFKGKSYTGKFSEVLSKYPSVYNYVVYSFDGGTFMLNYETQKLAGITFEIDTDKDYDYDQPDKYIDKAEKFAKKYLNNLDNYVFDSWIQTKGSYPYYVYKYNRVIDGYYTSESMEIRLALDGEFISFEMFDIGAFDGMDFLVDPDFVRDGIIARIERQFNEENGYKSLGFNQYYYHRYLENIDPIIIKTKSGDVALYSDYSITVKNDKMEGETISGFITFLDTECDKIVVDPYTSFITFDLYSSAFLEGEKRFGTIVMQPENEFWEMCNTIKENGDYTFSKMEPRATQSATYRGEKYTGSFDGGDSGYFDYFTHFKTEDGVGLSFRRNTNELVGISFPKESISEIKLEKETYSEIANDYASDFIDEIDEYELTVQFLNNNNVRCTYDRVIDGNKSIDMCTVTLTAEGELVSIQAQTAGCFNNMKLSINEEEIHKSVEKKLYCGFAAAGMELVSFTMRKEAPDYSHPISNIRVYGMYNGLIGVYDEYDCVVKDSEGNEYNYMQTIFTIIEENSGNNAKKINWREIE